MDNTIHLREITKMTLRNEPIHYSLLFLRFQLSDVRIFNARTHEKRMTYRPNFVIASGMQLMKHRFCDVRLLMVSADL